MASPRIYLDYNATATARPEAQAAFLSAVQVGGNASSVHAEGRRARSILETARRQVADLVGAVPEQVVFTSGGTEAANLAVSPMRLTGGGVAFECLIAAATEHAAVLKGHRFPAANVHVLPVTRDGLVDLDRLHVLVRQGTPAVVALQAANNETGVLQPVREAAAIVHAHGGVLICDAVQAAGRIALGPDALAADAILLSGHKLGGVAGAGAVVILHEGLAMEPLLRGGGQERGLRGGTENIPAIAAFGAAAEVAASEGDGPRLARLRDRFETGLRRVAPDVAVFCASCARLPNTSAFSIPGVAAEQLMMGLDLGGVAVSSGSACSSGKVGRSHVLEAMAVAHDLRSGAIRVSLGWDSTEADVDGAVEVLALVLDRIKGRVLRSAA